MADDAARIAELTQRIEELKGQNTEYQTQNALAVVGTHEQLINLQKETVGTQIVIVPSRVKAV